MKRFMTLAVMLPVLLVGTAVSQNKPLASFNEHSESAVTEKQCIKVVNVITAASNEALFGLQLKQLEAFQEALGKCIAFTWSYQDMFKIMTTEARVAASMEMRFLQFVKRHQLRDKLREEEGF